MKQLLLKPRPKARFQNDVNQYYYYRKEVPPRLSRQESIKLIFKQNKLGIVVLTLIGLVICCFLYATYFTIIQSTASIEIPVKLTLEQVNNASASEFHEIFGNVIELWRQGAIYCSALVPFRSVQQLIDSFQNYLSIIPLEDKLKILRHHPDLAGKLSEAGELTKESFYEQASARLNKIDTVTKQELNELNEEYKQKFGFPFIICVREARKVEIILKAMRDRINNSEESEIRTGIKEVKKICRLRILEIVEEK